MLQARRASVHCYPNLLRPHALNHALLTPDEPPLLLPTPDATSTAARHVAETCDFFHAERQRYASGSDASEQQPPAATSVSHAAMTASQEEHAGLRSAAGLADRQVESAATSPATSGQSVPYSVSQETEAA